MTALEKNLNRLKEMCGRKFKYEEREFTILTYKQTADNIEIVTDDGEWLYTNIFDLGVFLEKFKEITVPVLKKEIVEIKPKFIAVKNEAVDKVQSTLLDMLEKVKAFNSEEIRQQAQATINISDAILRGEKLKIELLNAANKL